MLLKTRHNNTHTTNLTTRRNRQYFVSSKWGVFINTLVIIILILVILIVIIVISSLTTSTRWIFIIYTLIQLHTIVWTGIQADLAFGGNFFHSHPLSTHIWYQNVQLTFRCQFRQTFTEQDSKWKQKATKSIHSSSRKKRIPHGISRNAD